MKYKVKEQIAQRKEKLDRWASGINKNPPKDKVAVRARNNAKSNVSEYKT